MAPTLLVGESLVGDGNEVAHIDLLIGSKDGPLGEAFAAALLNQKQGFTNLLAVVAPNLPAKPDTIIANKVTIGGEKQAVQMFGPAQAAVAGAAVLITYRRSEAAAQAVADGIAGRGGHAFVARADLGTRAGCEALVAEARERLGALDVWVNNAGADVLTGEAADWDWERKLDALLAVDLKGTIACSYAAGAAMREQPAGGAIVNMSWDHVATGMAGTNPELFSAVKGGVLAFSKSLARALAPEVRVNVLCPGWIETAFGAGADEGFRREVAESTPLQRWGTPGDVAAAAVWLASPAAAFITGQAINVNGGTVM